MINALPWQDMMALGIFYRSLVDVIKVLSIACADEAQGAPVYTESRRSVPGSLG